LPPLVNDQIQRAAVLLVVFASVRSLQHTYLVGVARPATGQNEPQRFFRSVGFS